MLGSELALKSSGWRRQLYRTVGTIDVDEWIWYWHYRQHLFPILRSMGSGKILDAGCGYGLWSFYLARNFPNFQITGIDVRDDAIAFCNRAKNDYSIDNTQFHKLVFEKLAYQDEYNILLSLFSLHYSYRKDIEILELFAKSLAPGGTLILTVPVANSVRPRATDQIPIKSAVTSKYGIQVDLDNYLNHYYPEELSMKLTQTGFTSHKIYPMVGRVGNLAKSLYADASINTILQIATWPIAFSLGWLDSVLPNNEGWFLFASASTDNE